MKHCAVHVMADALTRAEHRLLRIPCDGRTVAEAVLEVIDVRPAGGKGVRGLCAASGGVTEHAVVRLNGVNLRAGSPALWRPLEPEDVLDVAPASPGPDFGVTEVLLLFLSVASTLASVVLAPHAGVAAPSSQPTDVQRYAFSRYSRVGVRGEPIPTVLGEHPHYGPVRVQGFPGEGDSGESVLNLLYVISKGPIESIGTRTTDGDNLSPGTGFNQISGIQLNDQPIENFPTAKIWVRMGTDDQDPIPVFRDTHTPHEVAAGTDGALLANTSGSPRTGSDTGEVVTYTAVDPVDALVLRVRFPSGLYSFTPQGQVIRRRVELRWRTRAYPGGSFGAWTNQIVERSDQAELTIAPRIDLTGTGGTPALYEVQVQRVTPAGSSTLDVDEMRLLEVVEIQYARNEYKGCALLGIVLTAGQDLSSEPKVSVDVKGYKLVRVWDGISDPSTPTFLTQYSNNSAWLALTAATDTRVGMGAQFDDSRVDMPALIECGSYCDEMVEASLGRMRRRFTCNLVLVNKQSGADVLRTICATMRAIPIMSDRIRVIQDRPREGPVEVFTDGSIARIDDGTAAFSRSFTLTRGGLAMENQIQLQFANAALDMADDTAVFPKAGNLWLGGDDPEPLNAYSERADGITDPDQAADEATYRMTRKRALDNATTFTTSSPWIVCQPFDRVGVACNVAGWGVASGRVLEGSTVHALRLDRRLSLSAGVTYGVRIKHMDNSNELAVLALAPGEYDAGDEIGLETELAQAPAFGAEYAIGSGGAGSEIADVVVASIKRVESVAGAAQDAGVDEGGGRAARGGWEISVIPYDERIYARQPGDVVVVSNSTLAAERTAPGPVATLSLAERVGVGYAGRIVTLFWSQRPEDRHHTAYFRIFRRLTGSEYWQMVPGLAPGLTGVDLTIVDPDVAFDFRVVAVSHLGYALDVNDPRHPTVSLQLGLGEPPPPAPTGLAITLVSGNLYELSWDAVDKAAGYQVLGGGDTGTGRPNDGAEDCLVVGRTSGGDATTLQVELPAGRSCTFFVRSFNYAGRLSWDAAVVTEASPAAPTGQSVKNTHVVDFAGGEGTYTNCAWDGGDGRVEITDATIAGGGVWESGVIDTAASTATEICLRPATANAAEDRAMDDAGFDDMRLPSIEADQFGPADEGGALDMLMPPFPDDAQSWVFEVKTSADNITYTSYAPLAFGASATATFRYYKVRATMKRKVAAKAYSPALRGLTIVCTN